MKKQFVMYGVVGIILGIVGSYTFSKDEKITGQYSPEFWPDVSSEKIRNKYKQLVSLMKKTATMPTLYAMSQPYKSAYFTTFFSDAKRNNIIPTKFSIVTQALDRDDLGYLDLFREKKPVIEKFFSDLFSPETLTMIAHMQNRYGSGDSAKYDSSLFLKDVDRYAGEGFGKGSPSEVAVTPTIFGFDITSYAFLNNIINAIDTVKKQVATDALQKRIDNAQEKQLREHVMGIVKKLEAGLDTAIARQQSPDFDLIMNNLRDLVQKGNTQIIQELVDIERKYKK